LGLSSSNLGSDLERNRYHGLPPQIRALRGGAGSGIC
jgi:hypothetical protein